MALEKAEEIERGTEVGKHQNKAWYEKGANEDFAAMFACPGWGEEFNGRPAACQTGHNLEILLTILQNWGATVPERADLTITNAWEIPLYDEKDGISTPPESWVLGEENIQRIFEEIGQTKRWIFCFGKEAATAGQALSDRLGHGCKIIPTYHLSLQSLNTQITHDLEGHPMPSSEDLKKTKTIRYGRRVTATLKRLEIVAGELMEGMGLAHLIPAPYTLRQPPRAKKGTGDDARVGAIIPE
jgi:hypothetical protein